MQYVIIYFTMYIQALTAEAAGDASKRQDTLALRLQPLQSLLSYDLVRSSVLYGIVYTRVLCSIHIVYYDINNIVYTIHYTLTIRYFLLYLIQEDRSERLFEASIAAELLRSVLSVNFADTLTDFILSEHEELSGLCDQR